MFFFKSKIIIKNILIPVDLNLNTLITIRIKIYYVIISMNFSNDGSFCLRNFASLAYVSTISSCLSLVFSNFSSIFEKSDIVSLIPDIMLFCLTKQMCFVPRLPSLQIT